MSLSHSVGQAHVRNVWKCTEGVHSMSPLYAVLSLQPLPSLVHFIPCTVCVLTGSRATISPSFTTTLYFIFTVDPHDVRQCFMWGSLCPLVLDNAPIPNPQFMSKWLQFSFYCPSTRVHWLASYRRAIAFWVRNCNTFFSSDPAMAGSKNLNFTHKSFGSQLRMEPCIYFTQCVIRK